jgi:hypothetical protein
VYSSSSMKHSITTDTPQVTTCSISSQFATELIIDTPQV